MSSMSLSRHRGVSLIELVVFIVVVGIAMAGIFGAFNVMTAGSIDPQLRKQVLAVAESLLEEVALMPFTYCDPDDANAAIATSSTVGAGGCATTSEDTVINPESQTAPLPVGMETRYGTTIHFDNVSDYNGFSMTGIRDISENLIDGLGTYTATIAVAQASPVLPSVAAADALKITVTVSAAAGTALVGPGRTPVTVTLEGYRTRYAPNSLP